MDVFSTNIQYSIPDSCEELKSTAPKTYFVESSQ
jgi:hypothetical protein